MFAFFGSEEAMFLKLQFIGVLFLIFCFFQKNKGPKNWLVLFNRMVLNFKRWIFRGKHFDSQALGGTKGPQDGAGETSKNNHPPPPKKKKQLSCNLFSYRDQWLPIWGRFRKMKLGEIRSKLARLGAFGILHSSQNDHIYPYVKSENNIYYILYYILHTVYSNIFRFFNLVRYHTHTCLQPT